MTAQSEAAFEAAIDYFHSQLDAEIGEHTGKCSHPECGDGCSRPRTAKGYWMDVRDYHPDTLDEWKLGWAPPEGGVYDHLRSMGYDRDTIMSTGLFTDPERGTPSCLWRGRYVFPYFDAAGDAVYAIARTTGRKGGGAAGYDGHAEDFLAGKYAKVAHTREYVPFEEPIFGLNTLVDGEDVVIAEGIADAITAAEAGHAVLSPVTTQFKQKHFDALLDALTAHNVDRVYVVPDSERAGFSEIDSDDVPEEPEHIFEAINIPKVSPGIGGALRTARFLQSEDVDARVVDLPRSGLRKVDLDDYLHEWSDNLDSLITCAKPPAEHADYKRATETQTLEEREDPATDGVTSPNSASTEYHGDGASALWSLDVTDLNTDLKPGYRGKNPLGHTGDTETYFVVYEKENGACIGKDYKRPGNPRYTGCTYLLVEEEERDVSAPEGPLSPRETWVAWSEARRRGLLSGEDRVPTKALRHIAEEQNLYDFDGVDLEDGELPLAAHNRALTWVNKDWAEAEDAIDTEADEEATARRYWSREGGPIYSWEDVRYVYKESAQDGRQAAEDLLRSEYEFMTVEGRDALMVYDPDTGHFTQSLAPVRGELHDELKSYWSTHELNEILQRLRQKQIVEPKNLNGRSEFNDPHICVNNGVLNLFTRELKDHSPEYRFVDRVPQTYDPEASTDPYETFLEDVTAREEDWHAMMEMVGHALVSDANERYKKFLILTGDSDNGKSVFFSRVSELLEGVDGEENNVMSVKLSKLASNRFSKNSIYGSMANVAGEIDGKKIRNTADLKDITGGDEQEIEPKGGESFSDTINSTLMFAANDPPIIGERDKSAIATRIVPVELPYQFVEDPDGPMQKQRRPERVLEAELCTEEAMSGFLNLALDGLQRLEENYGDVSLPEPPMERLKKYEKAADPMKEFAAECLTNEDGQYVVKADVTSIYKEFAADNGYETGSNIHSVLHGVLQGTRELNYTTSRPDPADYASTCLPLRPWSERKRVLDRVSLTEKGLEYAEMAGLVVTQSEDDSTSQETLLGNLEPGRVDELVVRIGGQFEPAPWLEEEGWLVDESEFALDYKVREARGTASPLSGIRNDAEIRIKNAVVKTDDDGLRYVELSPRCVVETIGETSGEEDDGDSQPTAAADGGSESVEGVPGRVKEHLRTEYDAGDTFTLATFAGELAGDLHLADVEHALDRLAERTRLLIHHGGEYEKT